MIFKIAALFLIAASTKVQKNGTETQWLYTSGANEGYVCALMQQDGAKYDVFIPAAEPTPGTYLAAGLLPVPWQQFATEAAAKAAVKGYCN